MTQRNQDNMEPFRADAPAGSAALPWQLGLAQDIGARREQQDCIGTVTGSFRGRPALLAVLADGMGGMQDGARFSRIAVSCHQENFQRALDSAAQPAARCCTAVMCSERCWARAASASPIWPTISRLTSRCASRNTSRPGRPGAAALAFRALGTYADAAERSSDAWKQAVVHNHICGAEKFSLGVRADGSVIRTGSSLSFMENVVAVAAGGEHSVYLLADGRVTASGKNYHGETEVGDWTEIGIGNLQ